MKNAERMEELKNMAIESGLKVEAVEAQKNNVTKTGYQFSCPGSRVSACMYIEDMPELPTEVLFKQLLAKVKLAGSLEINVDDFNKPERIYPVLVNYEANKERLAKMPHKRFLDLAITYKLELPNQKLMENGTARIAVTDEVLTKVLNIDSEELHEIALNNARRDYPPEIVPILDIIQSMMPYYPGEEEPSIGLYVLGSGFNGASAMIDSETWDAVDKLMELKGIKKVRIIPCSVHELIIVTDVGPDENFWILDMIKEVNGGISPEERLSNNLYSYTYGMGLDGLEICQESEEALV